MIDAISGLYNFKLKMNLPTSHYPVQILLPELPQEAHFRITIIEVDEKFKSKRFPMIQHGYVNPTSMKSRVTIKSEYLTAFDQSIERIAVQVLAAPGVSRKIRVGPVRHRPHLNVTPMRKPMRCPWPPSTLSRTSKRRATFLFSHWFIPTPALTP